MIKNIDSLVNNQYRKTISDYLKWEEKRRATHTIVIGHNNPLPDGDCICSTHAFARTINLMVNNMKYPTTLNPSTIEIQYAAKRNPYIDKVLNYVDTIIENANSNSEMNLYDIVRSFDEKEEANTNFEKRIREALVEKKKKGLAVFVLDTDYLRTGYEDTLERLGDIVKDCGLEFEDVFFGIIDHHIPKDGYDVMPKGFRSDTEGLNSFKLILPSNMKIGGASSTCEIIMNILSTYSDTYKDMNAFKSLDSEKYLLYVKDYMSTMGKILIGGIRTDTGNFVFNGHESAIRAICEFVYVYNLDSTEYLKVEQGLIQSITEPKKSVKNINVYAYFIKNIMVTDDGFAYMVVNGENISEMGIKPIHTLQEFEWKAAVAITANEVDKTLKLELRSTDPKFNCRKLAQAIHPSGGGHLQAAGVTVQCDEGTSLSDASNKLVQQFIDYMRETEKYK